MDEGRRGMPAEGPTGLGALRCRRWRAAEGPSRGGCRRGPPIVVVAASKELSGWSVWAFACGCLCMCACVFANCDC